MTYKANFSIVRTPLYSFQNALTVDFTRVVQSLSFNESIYLSSPNLGGEIEKYLRGLIGGKDKNKLEQSLYRYYLRSSYRCTPFGLFAGISFGELANETAIELSPQSHYKKNTRFDTHFLSAYAQHILKDEAVKSSVKWFANNTAYQLGKKLRFIEYKIDKEIRSHHLANVDRSEYVQRIFAKAVRGATINKLANLLVDDEITFDDAVAFVHDMIVSCLLVSELDLMVTGKEYHFQLLEKLKYVPSANEYFLKLQAVVNKLKSIDEKGVGVSTTYYEEIIDDIKQWQVDFDLGRLFQCDLLKPAVNCQIGNKVIDELAKAIVLLDKITPPPDHPTLKKFIVEFEKRYESQEIPLLTVLDADTGIGYPVNEQAYADNTPLLNNFAVNNTNENNAQSHPSNKWSKFILQKYQQAMKAGSTEIELKEDEIKSLWKNKGSDDINNSKHDDNDNAKNELASLPDSVYSMGSLLASSAEEVDKGNFLFYHIGTAGPSAANLLGRFCYMDEELTRLTIELLRKEEQAKPDCIFAEVLHIAQARLGNISMRPILRQYEIPILTFPAVDEEHTIPLQDLMVSIKNGRIFLRSKKLNKEVIPRLTTAHNFSLNPVPHYHFLCDLQFQGIKGDLFWNWGFLNEFAYLPRVRYGKTILSKARWRVSLSDLSAKKNLPENELAELIKVFFAQNKIPNRVTISQGDNQLPIDIENHYCLQILTKDLKKFETLELHECLFNESNLLVRGPEGGYTNEIIIPWTKQVEKNNASQFQPQRTVKNTNGTEVQRSFLSGNQWHYVKIYCGVKTADRILIEVLKPITEELLSEQKITKWFFIRYADPDHHIRIRFSGQGNFYAEVTERLNKAFAPYLQNHLIWKVQTDTYNRELERYGSLNIENSETLFFHDSIACTEILSMLEGDKGDDLRWQFAMKGVDDLLNSFGLDLAAKKELMSIISANFLKEFNGDNVETNRQLSTKYRNEKAKIHIALQSEMEESHEFFPVWQVFAERSKNIAPCAQHINKLVEQNKLEVNKSDLLASYIHMFLNRFLRSKQRLQEMVIYDLLRQHYRSILARQSNEALSGVKQNQP
jgi:lantibiotic biosynthesis protein